MPDTSIVDAHVELFYDSAWQDVTPDADMRSAITATYGTADQHSDPTPTSIDGLVLDNRSLAYSPLNPESALYGKIGINTLARVRVGAEQKHVSLLGIVAQSYMSTPDSASHDVTGDIDIRIDVRLRELRRLDGKFQILAARWEPTGNNRMWALFQESDGKLKFWWSADGTAQLSASATVTLPADQGRTTIRVTMDVDNGASGRTITFYTGASIGATSWTQVGAAVTQAGVTSIANKASALTIGLGPSGGAIFANGSALHADVYAFQLRSGIGGTVVCTADIATQTDIYASTFVDAQGKTWTLLNQAYFGDHSVRAHVAISSWAPSWDATTLDRTMLISGKGIFERLRAGEQPLHSPLHRDLHGRAEVVAYWPLEDGTKATQFFSGKNESTTGFLLYPSGDVQPASYTGLDSSAALPTMDFGWISGTVQAYAGAADQRLMWVQVLPDAVLPGDRVVMLATTQGAIHYWDVVMGPTGVDHTQIRVRGFDVNQQLVFQSAFFDFGAINGLPCIASLWLSQSGAITNWQFSLFKINDPVVGAFSGSQTTTYGRFETVLVGNPPGVGGSAFGHVTILNNDVHTIWNVAHNSLRAWVDELAPARVARLTSEESIAAIVEGTAKGEALGPQGIDTLTNILKECAEADLGILGETRDALRVYYRPRYTLYDQAPALTLDASTGVIVNPLAPPLDVLDIINEVGVSRKDGGNVTVARTTGPLNTNPSNADPQGVGRRIESTTLNLASDDQLSDQAYWRLHMGTINAHRIASLDIEAHFASPALQQALLELRQGDLVRITNPLPGLPPDDIDLLVLGWHESISVHEWTITLNCEPADAWRAGSAGDTITRADAEGSTIAGSAFTIGTSTTMSLATAAGFPLWTQNTNDLPLTVRAAGAELTVTSIVGSSSPQTLTVSTNPVNGVHKTLPVGTVVEVADSGYAAL